MTNKFNTLYNEVYVGLFNEEAPLPPDPDADEALSPEQTAVPQDVPAPPQAGGQEAPPVYSKKHRMSRNWLLIV